MIYLQFSDGSLYRSSDHQKTEGGNLLLALPYEHTRFGSLLIDSLWFGRDVEIILKEEGSLQHTTAQVYRCHIVGPLFSRMLKKVRAEGREMASCWELQTQEWQSSIYPDSMFEGALEPEVSTERELHIDHSSLH